MASACYISFLPMKTLHLTGQAVVDSLLGYSDREGLPAVAHLWPCCPQSLLYVLGVAGLGPTQTPRCCSFSEGSLFRPKPGQSGFAMFVALEAENGYVHGAWGSCPGVLPMPRSCPLGVSLSASSAATCAFHHVAPRPFSPVSGSQALRLVQGMSTLDSAIRL